MVQLFLGTFSLMLIVILVRGSLPRSRLDQLATKTWKTAVFVFVGYLCFSITLTWYTTFDTSIYALASTDTAIDAIPTEALIEERLIVGMFALIIVVLLWIAFALYLYVITDGAEAFQQFLKKWRS